MITENKQEIANKICEALQLTRQFAPHQGNNGLLELRYIKSENGYSEYLRPVFEAEPDRNDGYYDINISGDSGTAVFIDVVRQFINRIQ
jgi:hypothetical protein